MTFQYYIPTKVLFGLGQLSQLHKQQLPGKKALIVLSAGKSTKQFGYLDRVEEQLKLAGVDYVEFPGIQPNPTRVSVMEGAAKARETGCDFILALGGGSTIDASKAISIMCTNDGDYWDYIPAGTGKGNPIKNDPFPVVVVGMTSGTGSESDPWAVVTDEDRNEKIGFGYEKTFPVLSILDPELTVSVPPQLTAFQGFDTFFHCAESYLNIHTTPISDMYSLKGVSLVAENLAAAVKDGSDLVAREKMMLANLMGAFVQSTAGCTSEHAMEHALSAYYPDLPHGAGLLLISREYFSFFAKSGAVDQRMIDMAVAMGKKDAKDPMDFVTALTELQAACGVDSIKMSDYGIKADEMLKFAQNARFTMGGMFDEDPHPITEADCIEIYTKSYR